MTEDIGFKGEQIVPRIIEEEMKQSYVDYAMSVIVGRALPDVRDGLKPVHRRILFAMNDMGMQHNKPFKKSARIVGEVLGKYHPHGDVAVYDSLARMVQSFSLRYPLIDGQGNFGCFTADTKVALVDGRNLSFIDLIKEHQQGKRSFTFTVDGGEIKIAEIKNPRMTRKNAEIIKVVLDNSKEIKCTPNHKFMLIDGNYREARYLEPGDSLMPAYFRLSTKEDDPHAIGYNMILQPNVNLWNFIHVLVDEWNIKNGVYTRSAGRVRHHLDFNKLNNHPDNIRRVKWGEHWKTHYDFTSTKHKTDPDYRARLAEGRKKFWNNENNRKSYSERMKIRNLKNWKNEDYIKQMKAMLSEVNKKYLKEHPQVVEEIRKRASTTMKRLWKIPKYKQLFHDKISACNRARKTNLTGKKKFMKICQYLKENSLILDKENFERVRKEIFGIKSFTSWDLGIKKYYGGNQNFLLCEINGNHKVIRVESLKEFADVYDLTVDKTHNFALASGVFVHNSIDGDSPAAMRYTEARLKKLAEEILQDIDKNTVKFVPNFDGSLEEPAVLPSKVPNLLINGSSGIAVGMATNVPPHNMGEIVDGTIALIDNPNLEIEELMHYVKGPDFPTGAIICGKQGIKYAYKTGRARIIVRARAEIEPEKNRIIVTEIPYMVNKAELIKQMADLVKDDKIRGIDDLRDESDREGMRVIIELKKDANPSVVLNQLYKHTRLQDTFGIIMVALVNNRPKLLSLKQLIQYFIEHRKEIVKKRTEFDLQKAKDRAHILEGLLIALQDIDKTVKLIKESKSVEEARNVLQSTLSITEKQALAILDMKLQRLAALEREKIKTEHSDLLKLISKLESVLASEEKILEIIKNELVELKESYGDGRKTEITGEEAETFEMEDLVKQEEMVITITHSGYIKRQPLKTYRQQKRGGRGIIAAGTKEQDFVEHLFIAQTHSYVLFFTNKGKIHWLKVYNIPEGSRQALGKSIVNLLQLQQDEKIYAFVPVVEFKENEFLIIATKNGTVKKTELMAYSNPRRGGIIAITLEADDELIGVVKTDGNQQIMLATKNGAAVRFREADVRPTGRSAKGVRGATLHEGDEIIGMVVADDTKILLTITENGYGKRTNVAEYRLTRRGGVGVRNIICSPRNGNVVAVKSVTDSDDLMFISKNGITIRTPSKGISVIGRATQGMRLMKLGEGDKIVAAAKIVKEEENGNKESNNEEPPKELEEKPENVEKIEEPKEELGHKSAQDIINEAEDIEEPDNLNNNKE